MQARQRNLIKIKVKRFLTQPVDVTLLMRRLGGLTLLITPLVIIAAVMDSTKSFLENLLLMVIVISGAASFGIVVYLGIELLFGDFIGRKHA